MPISSLLAAVVMAVASQAGTAEPSTAQRVEPVASETVAATDKDDKIVCRRVRQIGSNMMTRDCRTVGQRRREAAEAREAMLNSRGIDNLELDSR